MSRRVLGLYAIMAFAWGIPYFFIKVVVEELPPAGMVAVRTAMAAALLIPIAWRNGTLRAAARVWPWVLLFAVLEFAAPWYFLGVAEQRISSSLTGLLLATVPLIATVIGRLLGDRHVTDWRRLLGLVIGFAGVGILLGVDGLNGHLHWPSVGLVLACAVAYVLAPMIVVHKVPQVPSMAVTSLAMPLVALAWAGPAIATWPTTPVSLRTWASLALLAVVCTWLAFHFYWQLVDAVGIVRASIVTYLNPVVALGIGVALGGEPLTRGMLLGFPLVLLGSFYASRGKRSADEAAVAEA